MTDIPKMYLAEAVRRLNSAGADWQKSGYVARTFAATLQELGWTPPIDEARMAKARKVAAAVARVLDRELVAEAILCNHESHISKKALKAAYDALGED